MGADLFGWLILEQAKPSLSFEKIAQLHQKSDLNGFIEELTSALKLKSEADTMSLLIRFGEIADEIKFNHDLYYHPDDGSPNEEMFKAQKERYQKELETLIEEMQSQEASVAPPGARVTSGHPKG